MTFGMHVCKNVHVHVYMYMPFKTNLKGGQKFTSDFLKGVREKWCRRGSNGSKARMGACVTSCNWDCNLSLFLHHDVSDIMFLYHRLHVEWAASESVHYSRWRHSSWQLTSHCSTHLSSLWGGDCVSLSQCRRSIGGTGHHHCWPS